MQLSLEALRRIPLNLSVSFDELVFGDTGRGPDEALNLKFKAIRQFDLEERKIAEGMLDSLIVQHRAKRLCAPAANAPLAPKTKPDAKPKRASR